MRRVLIGADPLLHRVQIRCIPQCQEHGGADSIAKKDDPGVSQ